MKRVFLRKIILLLTAAFISFNLVGCNSLGRKKIVPISVDDPYSMKQMKSETLTFYLPGYEPDGSKKVLEQIEKKVNDSLNVKLDFKWVPQGAYINKIKYLMDSDNPLDAFVLTKNDSKDEFADMTKDQRLLDLTPVLKTAAPQLNDLSTPEDKTNLTYDGSLVGLPLPYRSSKYVCAVVKTDDLKKNGMQEIKNYDDYEAFLKGSNLSTTFNMNSIDMFAEINGYSSIGNNFVYKKDDPQLKLIPWEQTDAFRNAVKMLQRWKEKGYANNRAKDSNLGSPIEDIQNGWAKSVLVPWDELKNQIYFEALKDSTIKVFPLNQGKNIDLNTNVTALAINKKSKNVECILKFIEWVETKQDNYDLFMYGFNNENYTLKEDCISFPENKQRYYGWDGSQAFLNNNFMRPTESSKELISSGSEKFLDADSKYPATLGFIPNKATIESLLGKRDKDYKDFFDKLENGTLNLEEDIDDFIELEKGNGVDRVLSVLQEQLNQWKSGKDNPK